MLLSPPFKEGAAAPINKCNATLNLGAAGEVRHSSSIACRIISSTLSRFSCTT
jgi:hypothetical protein